MTKQTFKSVTGEEKNLSDYSNAFRDNRTELYKAATSFLKLASLVMLALWVLLTFEIVRQIAGVF